MFYDLFLEIFPLRGNWQGVWIAILMVAGGWLTWQGVRLVRREVSVWLLVRKLSPFFAASEIRESLRFYIPPSGQIGKNREENLLDHIISHSLTREEKLFTRFLVLAKPGMGKTTFLIHLFKTWYVRFPKPELRIKYISLTRPDAYALIDQIPQKEHTILLLDALDESIPVGENPRLHIDNMLIATKKFHKVVITAEAETFGLHPIGLEAGATYEYVGEVAFQPFCKIELLPFSPAQIVPYRKKSFSFRAGKKVKRIMKAGLTDRMKEMIQHPGLLALVRHIPMPEKQFTYSSQIMQSYVHQWIGKQTVEGEWFAFAAQVADRIYRRKMPRGQYYIRAGAWEKIADDFNLNIQEIKPGLFRKDYDGNVSFQHITMLAYFIAWKAFHEQWKPDDCRFTGIKEVARFYGEMCLEAYIETSNHTHTEFRTAYITEKQPLENIRLEKLGSISRLYLESEGFRKADLRFLRIQSGLKGIYLIGGEKKNISPYLLQELPHQSLNIYLISEENPPKPYHFVETTAFLNLSEGKEIPIQAMELKEVDLFKKFHPDRPVLQRPATVQQISDRRLLSLFETDLLSLPDMYCQPVNLENKEEHPFLVEQYEMHIGGGEWDLFDRLTINKFEDGSTNFVFYNTYTPTLLTYNLAKLVNRLAAVYGEDDHHAEIFTPDDEAQIEDGYWAGRIWAWGNTDKYANPLQICMERPGAVRLIIYGVRSINRLESAPTLDQDKAFS